MRKINNIITEKIGIIETYRKIINRNIFTILIIILIKYKRSAEVIIIKTKAKTIIINIMKIFIIMTLSYHAVWWKNILLHTHTHTHTSVNTDIILLTVSFALIEAPASTRNLVTSAWPLQAAHMRGVHPFWWNCVIDNHIWYCIFLH